MHLKIIILFLVITLVPFFTNAQTAKNDISKEFFKLYEENLDESLDFLFSSNKWMSGRVDAIDNLKLKLKQATNQMGSYNGYEKIGEDKG